MSMRWESIVRQNAGGVVNAALRVLGNVADAEDVSQEVFAEAFQRWQADADHHWAGLLQRMAVCRALDELRRKKNSEPLIDSTVDNAANQPHEVAIAHELATCLRHAVAGLPPREAEVFCLHYYEQLNHDQIAQLLEIQRGAVAKALCVARSRLNAVITQSGQRLNQKQFIRKAGRQDGF